MDAKESLQHMRVVLREVQVERLRQHWLWGTQELVDGTGWFACLTDCGDTSMFIESVLHVIRERRIENGGAHSDWLSVLLEEVFEAAETSDPVRLREELIQVAAVATQWVEALDRRGVAS
jgi:hypothetical protein